MVHLQGIPKPDPSEENLHQLQRLVDTHTIHTCVQFQFLNNKEHLTSPLIPDERISKIFTKHSKLFQTPSSLPPQRPVDHTITLTNILKARNKNQIREMLNQGLIQASTSAFSSTVLLVHKKYGSW